MNWRKILGFVLISPIVLLIIATFIGMFVSDWKLSAAVVGGFVCFIWGTYLIAVSED